MSEKLKIVLISACIGAVVGFITSVGVIKMKKFDYGKYESKSEKSSEQLIKEYYEIENAVLVSPHGLRKHMGLGDSNAVIVDLRSSEEYEKEHIISAINIPAYKDPNHSAYGDVERIVGEFKKLKEENPDKDIIVYCYSGPCMTGRKIGKMLSEHDIYVKHLGIGWNEWRYYWNLWNHDGEVQVSSEDYVSSGKEPGVPPMLELPGPCGVGGEFDC